MLGEEAENRGDSLSERTGNPPKQLFAPGGQGGKYDVSPQAGQLG